MANTVLSPVMMMPVPVPTVDSGPQYAFDLNSCLAILDQHDHTPGSGNPITSSALNINADLSIQNNNLTSLRSVRFTPQGSPIALPADIGAIFVSGVDLWYNDSNGNHIQITALGGVAGTPGSIANLVTPASASYVSGSKTFVFQSNVNQAANIDAASIILRNIPGLFGLTLSAPTLGSNYTITLPILPSVPSFVSIDNSGTMGATIPLAGGIVTSNIANSAITTSLIADANVTQAKMAANSVGSSQLVDFSVTPIKLSPYNYVDSGSSGPFSTTSSSPQDAAQTPPITCSGSRPVLVMITGGNTDSYISVTDGVNPALGFVYITRDPGATDLVKERFETNVIGSFLAIPGAISFIDFPSAGNKTYRIRASVFSSPTTTITINNLKITALEL